VIRERARVLDPFEGGAWVRTEAQAGCARCAAGQGCGSATLGRLLGDRLTRVEVSSADPLAAGALVEIGIDERVLTLASLVVYGLPLLLLLAGAALGAALGGDLAAAGGATLGLLAGAAVARHLARALAPSALRPRVLRALADDERCGRIAPSAGTTQPIG
jgi:sigma-E factor negative regulatory protein RseC